MSELREIADRFDGIIKSRKLEKYSYCNATLTTDNLSAGVYVMRLVNGNDVKTQKVVVR